MPQLRHTWGRIDSRFRLLAIPFLVALLFGAVEFGEPLEDIARGARNVVRLQSASGSIVVVGVDDRTGRELGGFNYSRSIDVRAVDLLIAAGARRVYFDRTYAFPTDYASDASFAKMLERYGHRVVIGAASPVSPSTLQPVDVTPLAVFLRHAEIASLNGLETPFSLSAKLTFGDTIGGRALPSLSSAIANRPHYRSGYFRPDWSIDTRTVPTLSFADVARGRFDTAAIRGRDVIVGPTATSLGDIRKLAFQGFIPGVYLHVVGAETLRKATPVDLGWWPAFAFSLAMSWMLVSASSRQRFWMIFSVAISACLVIPLYLDAALISIDIMPAVFLMLVAAWRAWSLMKIKGAQRINVRSGLSNLAALEAGGERLCKTLIAMKVCNLSRVSASFECNVERDLIGELRRRLSIDSHIGEIYHVEDTLCWLTPLAMERTLTDHLEGLHRLITQVVTIQDRAIDLSVAFGIDADVDRSIASRVASALLCAEEAGRSNDVWKLYDPERQHQASWQLALMSRLDLALDTGEIFVVFQPKVALPSMNVIGAEALVRWHHPTRGLIGPAEFIPAAEEHQRIGKLTSFVLDRAIAVASEARLLGHELSVAVNIAPQLISDPSFSNTVRSTLERHRLPPANLILEITESGHLTAATDRAFISRAYSEHGIKISLDDFGTGNASLERLRMLHPDEVKIDRQFVQKLHLDAEKREIVMATVAMAHALGGRVVAEGVERKEELDILIAAGCDAVQGYLTGKPMQPSMLLRELGQQSPSRKVVKRGY